MHDIFSLSMRLFVSFNFFILCRHEVRLILRERRLWIRSIGMKSVILPIKFILFGCLSFWRYHGWFSEQEYGLPFSGYIKAIIILNQSKQVYFTFFGGRLKSLSYISFEISICPSLSFSWPRLRLSLALWTILLAT